MDNTIRHKLKSLKISGFKSIGKEQNIDFGDINILIGANGVGKSNLVSFFQMLNHISTGGLQIFIGKQGYADSLLYYGSKNTDEFSAQLRFENKKWHNEYSFALTQSYQGQMMFVYEKIGGMPLEFTYDQKTEPITLGTGHQESLLRDNTTNHMAKVLSAILWRYRAYQFHDTSDKANIRQPGSIGDNRDLKSDASNLAAYLYEMRNSKTGKEYYQRIVARIQRIMPQFEDFFLEPAKENPNLIKLEWSSQGRQHNFGAHQISDGSLRFMALSTLLLQPPDNLPNLIVIDEPELGLHPEALIDLVGMIKIASQNSQIILSTQSSYLLDFFNVNDVIVVDTKDGNSVFNRLDEQKLAEWISSYTMAELWDKNLIGGRP